MSEKTFALPNKRRKKRLFVLFFNVCFIDTLCLIYFLTLFLYFVVFGYRFVFWFFYFFMCFKGVFHIVIILIIV